MLGDGDKLLKIAIGSGNADYAVATRRENGIDVITGKMTARNIWVAFQKTERQRYYQSVTFLRDYLGGGQYGELRKVWASGSDPITIACENIK